MPITHDEARAILARWQPILRLADWDIDLRLVTGDWRKSGDIKVDLDDRKAVLLLNAEPRSENLEETIVHELVHLRLRVDQMLVELLDAVFGTAPRAPRPSPRSLHDPPGVHERGPRKALRPGSPARLSFGRLRERGGARSARGDGAGVRMRGSACGVAHPGPAPLAQPLPAVAAVVIAYAVAMAFLESAVVVYLQRALGIDPRALFPLRDPAVTGDLAFIEVGREAATLVMLAAVGWLAGRSGLERLAWTAVAFGTWDIVYYAWLWAFIGWPSSPATWDLLFLIPVPWTGPVWAPVAVSLALVGFGLAAAARLRAGRVVRVGRRRRSSPGSRGRR